MLLSRSTRSDAPGGPSWRMEEISPTVPRKIELSETSIPCKDSCGELVPEPCKAMNFWEQIRDCLQHKISAESYDNWLKGTTLLAMDEGTMLVSVPDRETRAWLETEEYSTLVREVIRELNLPVARVSYEAKPEKGMFNQATAAVGPAVENEMESVAAAL